MILSDTPRKRLQQFKEPSLEPFVRAESITDCSVYWCGVRGFPISVYERDWILEFLRRFAAERNKSEGLREETFLQTKVVLPDLMELFQKRARTYTPIAGMTLIPGTAPIKIPVFDDLRQATQKAGESGKPLDVTRWMPDHAHWFLDKSAQAERNDFFGHGGLFSILLKPDSTAHPKLPKVPRILSTHPAYTGGLEGQYAMALSMKDPFLAKSKEVFGLPFHEDPSYDGLPFVLPLLTSASIIQASPKERARWFEVFDSYWIESKPDNGLLLVVKHDRFDEVMTHLLEEMRDDGFRFRSVG